MYPGPPAPEFWEYPWLDTPIATFAARDGATLRAHVYKPANYRKGGPAVVFVHGAGYLQNVHRWWSYYAHEYMFHQLLMEHGYLVADVDYRGSAGYGRDWRTAIYQHMGCLLYTSLVRMAEGIADQRAVRNRSGNRDPVHDRDLPAPDALEHIARRALVLFCVPRAAAGVWRLAGQ